MGDVQVEKALASSWHRNVLGSLFELKLKLAPVWFVGFGGLLAGSIVTTGLTVSTSQEKFVVLSFPAASVPLSVNVCLAFVSSE